jgi:hypothetical protein
MISIGSCGNSYPKSQIERGVFVERSILKRVLEAFGDNRVLILAGYEDAANQHA